ncbi:uncharacterized protein LOC100175743 [Ciona intestinalis]
MAELKLLLATLCCVVWTSCAASNCSVAFYPMTACLDDGSRSAYIQFEDCLTENSRVRFAWVDIVPVSHRKRPTSSADHVSVKWSEISIPRWFPRGGRLTVFYTKDENRMEGIQMVVPRCHN